MQPFMENFGAYLAAFRDAHGMDQIELSDKTGISEARIKDIETNNIPVYAHEVYRISQAMGVLVSDLMQDPLLEDLELGEGSVSEDAVIFYGRGWIPHNMVISSVHDLAEFKSKPTGRKSVLCSVRVSQLATQADIEQWYKDNAKPAKSREEEETLLEDE